MAGQFRIGFNDPKGIFIKDLYGAGVFASGATLPTNGTTGYETGCIFILQGGGLYVNTGTVTSCTFALSAATSTYFTLSGINLSVTGIAGTAAPGGTLTFTAGAGGTTNNAGGAISSVGGAGAGSSAGGVSSLTGGVGGATGAGGAVVLTGGVGGATSGSGGPITITSGAAGATTGVAGAINIAVGAATAGAGAAVTITGGAGAGSTNAGGNVNLVPGAAVSTGTPGEIQVNGVSGMMEVMYAQESQSAPTTGNSYTIFLANRAYRVKGARTIASTAGGSGCTVTVNKDTGTSAPGAGTALLTGAMALSGTANTAVTGTLISTVATLTLAAGDRLSLTWAGTISPLAGAVVSVFLSRLEDDFDLAGRFADNAQRQAVDGCRH